MSVPAVRERVNIGACAWCSRAAPFWCMTLVFASGSILVHYPGVRERINRGA